MVCYRCGHSSYRYGEIMFYPANPVKMSVRHPLFDQHNLSSKWIAEPKLHGIRCLTEHHHNRIDLWTRKLMRISAPSVDLRQQIKDMIPDKTILDGVLIGDGKFKEHFCVFDIPVFKGETTGHLFERYDLLIQLFKYPSLISIVRQSINKRALFYKSQPYNIILKDMSSYYTINHKSGDSCPGWIEITS